MNNAMAKDGPQLKLKKCGCCDKTETMHGDFKKCSVSRKFSCCFFVLNDVQKLTPIASLLFQRCHQQPYCSKKVRYMIYLMQMNPVCTYTNVAATPSNVSAKLWTGRFTNTSVANETRQI